MTHIYDAGSAEAAQLAQSVVTLGYSLKRTNRRSPRKLAQSKHSSKWHSLTTTFIKLTTPSVDDLHVAVPVGTQPWPAFNFNAH